MGIDLDTWATIGRIVSGIFLPVIAAIGSLIALQQYLITKNKLKLDLYDKRFEIYRTFMDFCIKVIDGDEIKSQEYSDLGRSLYYSRFLFKEDVATALQQFVSKAKQYRLNVAKGENAPPSDNESAVVSYFNTQASQLQTLFKPYLQITKR
jgi:hypothetical protein